MSAQHTPGPRTVRVEIDGRTCEVYFGLSGMVGGVQLVLRTRGDSRNTRRRLRLDGPMAQAAIAAATGSASHG